MIHETAHLVAAGGLYGNPGPAAPNAEASQALNTTPPDLSRTATYSPPEARSCLAAVKLVVAPIHGARLTGP